MLLTEKEAAEKWCPMARAPGGMFVTDSGQDKRIGVTQNRGYQMGGALSNCMCIGSRCMAWRRVVIGHDFDNPKDGIAPSVYAGYCGAFGKVEP